MLLLVLCVYPAYFWDLYVRFRPFLLIPCHVCGPVCSFCADFDATLPHVFLSSFPSFCKPCKDLQEAKRPRIFAEKGEV